MTGLIIVIQAQHKHFAHDFWTYLGTRFSAQVNDRCLLKLRQNFFSSAEFNSHSNGILGTVAEIRLFSVYVRMQQS